VALVFNLPAKVCEERNRGRPDRNFGPHVVRQQKSQLRRSIRGLKREGFSHVFFFDTPEDAEAADIARTPLWNDKRDEPGPFDIIGDVHGCCDELEALLQQLGYIPGYVPAEQADDPAWGNRSFHHAAGRKALFVGDLVDRGPRILDTLRLVRNMVAAGSALCVPGNHDVKLLPRPWRKGGRASTRSFVPIGGNDIRGCVRFWRL
jgi:protein phosphatase